MFPLDYVSESEVALDSLGLFQLPYWHWLLPGRHRGQSGRTRRGNYFLRLRPFAEIETSTGNPESKVFRTLWLIWTLIFFWKSSNMRAAVKPGIMTTMNCLPFYNKLLKNARMRFLSSSSFAFINESIPLHHWLYFTFCRRFLALLVTHLRLSFRLLKLLLGRKNQLSSVSLKTASLH